MDVPHETIEIGLDAKSHQITIVVGSDTSSNGLETQDVQSVVILHDFSSSPRKGQRWTQRDRSVSRSSRRSSDSARQASSSSKSKLSTPAITMRSDLLRPESPMPHRSSPSHGLGSDAKSKRMEQLAFEQISGPSPQNRHRALPLRQSFSISENKQLFL